MAYSRLAQIHSEPRGTSSAVASVLFSRGGDGHQVTKSGSYIYHGDAATFHEWEFRTRLRVKAASNDPDKYADAMSRVIDGLRGEAFIIAEEVGLDRLWHAGGEEQAEGDDSDDTEFVAGEKGEGKGKEIPAEAPERPPTLSRPGGDILVDAIKRSVFPLTTYEAKELFRQYCRPAGPLIRQNGESMQQYISRRKRCWKLLKELDPEIMLSDGHRADMLLDLAGLDRNEKTMIQASIGNA